MTVLFSIFATIISVATILIARWQAKVATEKLRYDLYDRRFSIYIAFHELLVAATAKEDFEDELRKANAARAHSPFLLDPTLTAFLGNLHREAFRVNAMAHLIKNEAQYTLPERVEEAKKLGHDRLKLTNTIDDLVHEFDRFLGLRDLARSDVWDEAISWIGKRAVHLVHLQQMLKTQPRGRT